ncbi:MAG: nuclear transport factor 2 family protein [Flavobacteriaceae bacterium]
MKSISLTCFLIISFFGFAQEEQKIKATLENYLNGTSYNVPDQISSAFYPEADLFLSKKGQDIFIMSVQEYSDLFKKREKGVFNGRTGRVLAIDISNTIAMAKAEIQIEKAKLRFIDIFLLKKIEKEWKIISKAATEIPWKD